jgi:hypothetical protein
VARGALTLLLGPPSQAVSVPLCQEHPAAGVEVAHGVEQEDMVAAWAARVALDQLGCLGVVMAVIVVHGRAGLESGARARNGQEFGPLAGQYNLSAAAGYALTLSALRQLRHCLPLLRPQLMVKL